MSKKKRIVGVVCPFCNQWNSIPEGAGVNVICSYCGKNWYTEGIEVSNKEATKFYDELDKENKKDFESRKDEN